MKRVFLCLLVPIVFAACNKPEPKEEEESTKPAPTPAATPTPARVTPISNLKAASPGQQGNDWMWKTSKGKPRDNDPLKVKDDPFEKSKK